MPKAPCPAGGNGRVEGEGSGGVKSTIPSLRKVTPELGSGVPQAGANCRAGRLDGVHSVKSCNVLRRMLGAAVFCVRTCFSENNTFPMCKDLN